MDYSLQSRFWASWWGMEIGAGLAQEALPSLSVNALEPKKELNLFDGKVKALQVAEALVRQGRVDYSQVALGNLQGQAAPPPEVIALPLILFYHQDLMVLGQHLRGLAQGLSLPPGQGVGLEVLGYTIAQALQNRLQPLTLVPQLLAGIQDSPSSPLLASLPLLQTLLQQRASLYTALGQLRRETMEHLPLLLALYCFLSSREDGPLSLGRSARLGEAYPIVPVLVGMLVGADRGLGGMPLASRIKLLQGGPEKNQIDRLFAAWAGIEQPGLEAEQWRSLAIAAPNIIRPR